MSEQQQPQQPPKQEPKQHAQKKQQQAQPKEKKESKSKFNAASLPPVPSYISERIKVWNELKAKHEEEMKNMPDVPIKITLPDGKVVDGIAYKTTPYDVAKGISRGLADNIVSSLVDEQVHDISRPMTKDCNLVLCKFDSEAGKKTFWHSSAHILGQAMERIYGGSLCIGPATSEGFYYDIALPNNEVVSQDDFDVINAVCQQIVSEKQPFERLNVPRDLALEMFKYNKYKTEIISKIPAEDTVSLYRCGNLVDLCRGPHVPNTSYVKAFTVTKNSSAYWLGKAENDPLQRVYGVAFPDKKQLAEYENFQREAALRDHRNVGKAQELFFFHPFSPGCAFFLPHGARIFNKLSEFIKAEYHRRGFTEVITPTMFSAQLWQKSGHWDKYRENMFPVTCDNQPYSLKPMNCPSHCLMFGQRVRSYRELPIRYADFGVLHRNELAGALTGLTRVRKFQQDDAHIFCTADMIETEIQSCLEFMQYVYGIFGFEFDLELSTRPESCLGTKEQWDLAESQLQEALNKFGKPWKLNPGDGAFYGPKIDIHITDALKRSHQCATIQLDFQLPERFELEYQSHKEEIKRPVIIHRAILGSVERMMAILIEHTAGKWPLWLSPRQVMIVPITPDQNEYSNQIQKQLVDAGFHCDTDQSDKTLNKRILEARSLYNFIIVIGKGEVEANNISVRSRENDKEIRVVTVPAFIDELKDLCKQFK